jgi:hypothetical protein
MITQALCTSFKAELLLAVHDFRVTDGDTFKLALYTSAASINANTTSYTAVGEVTGTNYTAGGAVLTRLGVSTSNNSTSSGVGFTDFSDLTFSNVSISARGALIYNTTPSALSNSGAVLVNPAVCVLDFGSDKVAANSNFTIIFPAGASSTAIVRVS